MKRFFLNMVWYFRYRFLRKKTKLTPREEPKNDWTFLDYDLSDPVELKKLAHTSIALNVMRKYFLDKGKFTSNHLYFFIKLDGYSLTRKQVWRVIYKLHKIHLINKVVLCSSDPKSAPYYKISNKLLMEWRTEN